MFFNSWSIPTSENSISAAIVQPISAFDAPFTPRCAVSLWWGGDPEYMAIPQNAHLRRQAGEPTHGDTGADFRLFSIRRDQFTTGTGKHFGRHVVEEQHPIDDR